MFSIRRFGLKSSQPPTGDAQDAGANTASPAAGSSKIADRIQELQERAAKRQKVDGEAVDQGIIAAAPIPRDPALPPNLNIHPSRLLAAPALRAAQSRVKGQGVVKEKTKAKQRYLNKKKERRKAREKSKKTSRQIKPGEGKKKHKEEGKGKEVDEADEAEDSEDAVEAVAGGQTVDGSESESESSSAVEEDEQADESVPPQENGDEKDRKTPEIDPASISTQQLQITEVMDVDPPEESKEKKSKPLVELQPFPEPELHSTGDVALLRTQGLPQGFASPMVVDPKLTGDLDAQKENNSIHWLREHTRNRLRELGIEKLFAVQASVVPLLLSAPNAYDLSSPYRPPRDVCISAPTGSGKTLAYCIPIVEVLRNRVVPRVRALILLPTRDLVIQVRDTLESVAKGSGLKIASVTGAQSFAHEQGVLVDEKTGDSLVDIVIATPGRLIDHVDVTPGFTLQHLRFLVLDEADRLLGQSFNEWLPRLMAMLDPRAEPVARREDDELLGLGVASRLPSKGDEKAKDDSKRVLAPAWLQVHLEREKLRPINPIDRAQPSVQKLLFSATLTRDPARMAALQLRRPIYVTVRDSQYDDLDGGDFAIPDTLKEHMIVTSAEEKPMVLFHLLQRQDNPIRQGLCFTKSIEAAKRLHKLLELFFASTNSTPALRFAYYSSELPGSERVQILNSFQAGKIDLIICSDLIARGIDIADVQHVISYDVPVDMRKYVHRVGRTARAGKVGEAWSLVEEQEAKHFKAMLSRGGRPVANMKQKLKKGELDPFRERYHEALAQLAQHFGKSK